MFWKLYILYGVVTVLNKVAGVFIQPVARAVVALGHILVSGAMEFQTCDISAFTCSDWASMLTDNPSMKLLQKQRKCPKNLTCKYTRCCLLVTF